MDNNNNNYEIHWHFDNAAGRHDGVSRYSAPDSDYAIWLVKTYDGLSNGSNGRAVWIKIDSVEVI